MTGGIANERPALAASLWTATAHPAPDRPALTGAAEADVVVIGGGFTGLSAALHLAEGGARVILLEAETPGWGASGRNGGQVNPGLKDTPEETEARFGADLGGRMVRMTSGSADLVFDLIARHGIDCDAARMGWLRPATSARTLAGLLDVARQWRARGVEVEPVSRAEMARLLGTEAYAGGVIDRRGGNLHPLNYALGLAAAAERHGARICGQSRVTGIEETGEAVTVATATGRVAAKTAIIATNAYTGPLAPPLGKTVVPVTSVQVATAPLGSNIAGTILPEGHSPTDTRRLLLYFRKDAEGRFLMGGRGTMSDGSTRARQKALIRAAEALYPQLKGTDWPFAWGGHVAITQDHMPGMHRLSPRVLAGLGYNGRGVGMATLMGRILADWAQGRPEAELDFPVTEARPFPFHSLRGLGTTAMVASYGLLDRIRP